MNEKNKGRIQVPNGALSIISGLQRQGYEAFIVGGCVRDSLLGRTPNDWDICTSATPEEVKEFFSACSVRTIDTGIAHGTVTVDLEKAGQYEVTTFRIDGSYSDNRHPDSVEFVNDITKDLARRDFTINAMAYNEFGIIDPFGGIDDLKNKVVSCVGDPDKRFEEDALRILRALRFSSTYGFDISQETSASIHKNVERLKSVSAERVNSELCKMIVGENILQVLLEYSDVISTIIPEMGPCIGFNQNNRFHEYTVYDHIAHAVSNSKSQDVVVKMALLLHDIGKPCCYTEDENGGHFHGHGVISHKLSKEVLNRLKFDNRSKEDILELVLFHDSTIEPTEKIARKWLNKIGEKQFYRLLDIRMADILAHKKDTQASRIERCNALRSASESVIEQNQCFKLKDLAVNGRDIMRICNITEGRSVGAILKMVLDEVIYGRIENDVSEIEKFVEDKGMIHNEFK